MDKNCNIVNHRLHVCTEAHNIDSFIAVSVSKISLDKMFSSSRHCLRVTRCQGMSGNDDGWGCRVTTADCLPRPAPVTPPRAGTRARWAPQLKQYKWDVTLLFNRCVNELSRFHLIIIIIRRKIPNSNITYLRIYCNTINYGKQTFKHVHLKLSNGWFVKQRSLKPPVTMMISEYCDFREVPSTALDVTPCLSVQCPLKFGSG